MPQGEIRVSCPRIVWRIWPHVISAKIFIDGQPADCQYDSELRAVVGQVSASLKPGKHQVRCTAEFSGGRFTERIWSFVVLPGSVHKLAANLTAAERSSFALIQAIRRSLGLDELALDSSLQAAARSHGEYLLRNGKGGHLEARGAAGFLARTPSERARLFGATEEILVEDVAILARTGGANDNLARSAVVGLFEAPYHRLPFLNPALRRIGLAQGQRSSAGRVTSATVLLFGRWIKREQNLAGIALAARHPR